MDTEIAADIHAGNACLIINDQEARQEGRGQATPIPAPYTV
jgi:hypothetical protein